MEEEIVIPAVILGLPLMLSENPYLAVPVAKAAIEVNIEESHAGKVSVKGVEAPIRDLIEGFTRRMVNSLQLDIGIHVNVGSHSTGIPYGGLYAALTLAILLETARFYGEEMREYEALEYSRLLDNIDDPSWQSVIDALRYSSLKASAVVYRNDEEYAEIEEVREIPLEVAWRTHAEQKVGKNDLGPDLYGALIHTVGVMVLEGVVRVREGGGSLVSLTPLFNLQAGLVRYFWDIAIPQKHGETLIVSPGLPNRFEVLSPRG